MGHPPPATPPRSVADVAISIILMVLTVLVGAGAAFLGLFMLAFLDHCPPATCSVEGAVTSVLSAVGIVALVGVLGIVTSIIALVGRKRAWPFTLDTFGMCLAMLVVDWVAFSAAVGG
ncbi:hypothetical protein [Mycolicibacterium sarraceniae]|uniref:Uncharacterized protein n=1 Tax=Mycolicibacterium sarraceniae TaxID=1534348 RepID=A0A7I7SLI0_9MYCO|nr:hypothetical protein [Mycolicibacterium sarraceniae]BBY57857.1 hypothetical protein MSAR_09930 [Mycolicibacterium sarraceniae]